MPEKNESSKWLCSYFNCLKRFLLDKPTAKPKARQALLKWNWETYSNTDDEVSETSGQGI